ncbi:hypothetical protein G6F46_005539 [Rhizopus delemar]|uniref:Uncharacterized protein n=3 Tax=Rhizopus TaxID=4842 RepID=I1CMK0_RHIO9|nr:hypothetical protein RO3G_14391 [Rhizopus delemar RA 99-880]KAG1462792.1 hypothetical protein G6F55_002757 [Rhizopus delemar]KAG1543044.1 hypothetical protein G6F51_006909 [Rhizopus arrhizus]KAG1500984.1 hypothetical protein G6F54_003350 [Rhizopus delemar]KAG1514637.1 hypothetical protein G6F53_003523 [Rhizopus delemar]|eukprot:EIE89680.1 hypothetical protein RO3G_14391 [Rhizopus delemar RA 99-880]
MSSKAKTRLLQKSELFNFYTSYVVNWDPTKPTETFTTKTSQNDIPIPKPIKPAGHEEANLRVVVSSLFAFFLHHHMYLDEHL